MNKTAIYSCNFGDYRDEFERYYNCYFDKNIDYFLFTDKILTEENMLALSNWNICNINILEEDKTMNRFRWTSKYVKFVLPEKLKNYEIIVWVDNKKINDLNKLNCKKIQEIINRYPKHDIFNLKHPHRNTPQEELLITIELGIENKESGEYFLKYIDGFISKFDLPDSSIIIRKNNLLTNEALEYCFYLMKEYSLKRDQNIYNFALDNKNLIPVLLNSFTLDYLD